MLIAGWGVRGGRAGKDNEKQKQEESAEPFFWCLMSISCGEVFCWVFADAENFISSFPLRIPLSREGDDWKSPAINDMVFSVLFELSNGFLLVKIMWQSRGGGCVECWKAEKFSWKMRACGKVFLALALTQPQWLRTETFCLQGKKRIFPIKTQVPWVRAEKRHEEDENLKENFVAF